MGLRWVRENIGAFGGDPTRITLIGHDTGAALVNLLLLAPYSKGRKRKPTTQLILMLPSYRNTFSHAFTAIRHERNIAFRDIYFPPIIFSAAAFSP